MASIIELGAVAGKRATLQIYGIFYRWLFGIQAIVNRASALDSRAAFLHD
jgi:hypothetical protein